MAYLQVIRMRDMDFKEFHVYFIWPLKGNKYT